MQLKGFLQSVWQRYGQKLNNIHGLYPTTTSTFHSEYSLNASTTKASSEMGLLGPYTLNDATMLSENANKNLRSQRAVGMANPLTELEIFDLADSTYPTIQQHMTYHILRFLLDSPEFDLKTYQHKKDNRLEAPAPVDQSKLAQFSPRLTFP